MKMWISAALSYLNSLSGLDKPKQLKDSHPSVACTYKGFSWYNQAGWNCDSLLYCNPRNQAHKSLEWRPGCDSATKQTWALSTYIGFFLVFHKLLPRQGSDPLLTAAHKDSRLALGAGWHPAPAGVKCYPVSQLQASCPCSSKPPWLLHSPPA